MREIVPFVSVIIQTLSGLAAIAGRAVPVPVAVVAVIFAPFASILTSARSPQSATQRESNALTIPQGDFKPPIGVPDLFSCAFGLMGTTLSLEGIQIESPTPIQAAGAARSKVRSLFRIANGIWTPGVLTPAPSLRPAANARDS